MKNNKAIYKFRCAEHEADWEFQRGVSEKRIRDSFVDWCFSKGYYLDELDVMFESGDAEYNPVK